jgi:hypothetical protein
MHESAAVQLLMDQHDFLRRQAELWMQVSASTKQTHAGIAERESACTRMYQQQSELVCGCKFPLVMGAQLMLHTET